MIIFNEANEVEKTGTSGCFPETIVKVCQFLRLGRVTLTVKLPLRLDRKTEI